MRAYEPHFAGLGAPASVASAAAAAFLSLAPSQLPTYALLRTCFDAWCGLAFCGPSGCSCASCR